MAFKSGAGPIAFGACAERQYADDAGRIREREVVSVTGVPCSDINVASIAFARGDTAIGDTLIDIGDAATQATARFARDNGCCPRSLSAGPARNT